MCPYNILLYTLDTVTELVILVTLTFNIVQATYALQFPPKSLPPPTPATPRPNPLGLNAKSPKSSGGLNQSQRKLIASTPTVRLAHLIFSMLRCPLLTLWMPCLYTVFSPSILYSINSLGHDNQTVPQSQKPFSSSFYPSTPLSSPSRILNYSALSQADTSISSSASSLPNSPSPSGGALNSSLLRMSLGGSPSLAAYRGKHRNGSGREYHSLIRPKFQFRLSVLTFYGR